MLRVREAFGEPGESRGRGHAGPGPQRAMRPVAGWHYTSRFVRNDTDR